MLPLCLPCFPAVHALTPTGCPSPHIRQVKDNYFAARHVISVPPIVGEWELTATCSVMEDNGELWRLPTDSRLLVKVRGTGLCTVWCGAVLTARRGCCC